MNSNLRGDLQERKTQLISADSVQRATELYENLKNTNFKNIDRNKAKVIIVTAKDALALFGDTNQEKKVELLEIIQQAEETLPPSSIKGLIEAIQSKIIEVIFPERRWLRNVLYAIVTVIVVAFLIHKIVPTPIFLTQPVVIGSMEFAEQHLVAELIAQMLEEKHVAVKRVFDQDGVLLRRSIETGDVDCFMEYTGAPFTLVFNQTVIPDSGQVYDVVRQKYADRGISVSPPFPFQNEWAILIRSSDSLNLNLKRISDIALLRSKWRAGFVPDFLNDAKAGASGMKVRYGLHFAQEQVINLDHIYEALKNNDVDIISGNSTDGERQSYNFVKLDDDLNYFPPYQPIILARQDTLRRIPELQVIMTKLPSKMNLDEMRRLNYEVRKDPDHLSQIAQGWLITNGLIKAKRS